MNNLQIFENPNFGEIRTSTTSGGDPLFVAVDVCRALEIQNPSDAVKRLEEDEKLGVVLNDPHGRQQETTCLTEPGLYSLVLGSRKPEAKAFKRWITHEVIPAIRKTGSYSINGNSLSTETLSPELRLLINLELKQKEQQKALESTNEKLDGIRDIITLNPTSWRSEARNLIVKIAHRWGGNDYIRDVQAEVFKLVDERAGASLETRLTNKRRRMADEGVCKSKRDKLNKVDVIADDKKLIEIYLAVVKDMAIKYDVAA